VAADKRFINRELNGNCACLCESVVATDKRFINRDWVETVPVYVSQLWRLTRGS
jgi:hypothetical protein